MLLHPFRQWVRHFDGRLAVGAGEWEGVISPCMYQVVQGAACITARQTQQLNIVSRIVLCAFHSRIVVWRVHTHTHTHKES